MKREKRIRRSLLNPKNLPFGDALKIAECFGFTLDRVKGSHHLFKHPAIPELLNLQSVDGKAKPYQVKQLISLIEKYDLPALEEK